MSVSLGMLQEPVTPRVVGAEIEVPFVQDTPTGIAST
jgi:hypothetical protein